MAFGLIAGAAQSAQANLLGNGSFETPDVSLFGELANGPGTPWMAFGDPAARLTNNTEAEDGLQSLKTFGPFDFIGGGVGATQRVAATPGNVYAGEIFAYQQADDALGGENFGVYKLEFLDESFGLVGGDPLVGVNIFESPQFNASSPVDEWVPLGTGGVAPEGTAFVQAVFVQVQLGEVVSTDPEVREFRGGAIFWDNAAIRDEGSPAVSGDFNGDGRVDNDDLNLLLGSWGDSTVPPAWINGFEPPVDNDELNALLGNWGFGTGTAVPEPTAFLVCLLSTAAALGRRR